MTSTACIPCPTCGQLINKETPHTSWEECMRFVCSQLSDLARAVDEATKSNQNRGGRGDRISFLEKRIADLERLRAETRIASLERKIRELESEVDRLRRHPSPRLPDPGGGGRFGGGGREPGRY